jgi:hypothetical protein
LTRPQPFERAPLLEPVVDVVGDRQGGQVLPLGVVEAAGQPVRVTMYGQEGGDWLCSGCEKVVWG